MQSYQPILDIIKKKYQELLGTHLTGIYIHGSIAFGCFNWDKSDIDLIAVVNHDLSVDTKIALIDVLTALDLPEKGIEISFVSDSVCQAFVYPTPFLLHYSKMWEESFARDPVKYCALMQGIDPDLAAHFTVILATGIVLCGKPITDVFGAVPKEAYLDSILRDIGSAQEEIESDPIYFILNLCRIIAYTRESCILSKKQAGEWALSHLSISYTPLIKEALTCYCSSQKLYVDSGSETLFCEYAFHLLSL